MTENRIVEGGAFGPVFAQGVNIDGNPSVIEGIVEVSFIRYNSILVVELTVDAANELTDRLLAALGRAIPPPNNKRGDTQ